MSIGEVGRRTGFEPTAIPYRAGLGFLPKPQRAGGKRRYGVSVLEWLVLISLARAGGFTMAESRRLVAGFTPGTRPDARKQLAAPTLADIDEMVARAERMRAALRIGLDCGFRLEDCGALLDLGTTNPQHHRILPTVIRRRSTPGVGR